MPKTAISRIAAARSFIGKLWRLAAPYWWTDAVGIDTVILGVRVRIPERWIARGVLALILAMAPLLVWIAKLLNDWNARFFNALQAKDEAAFWAEIQIWILLVAVYLIIAVYRLWIRQLLTIRWRRWLTEVYFRNWLGERVYYRMELVDYGTDNPEQRIEQDCALFCNQTLAIVLGLISEILTLGTFAVILWQLSGSITLPILGGIEIPGYMMWLVIAYAALGSWATYKIGRPLVQVNFDLERYNADLRYRMTRVRENAEGIALYRGEEDEKRRLRDAFTAVYETWWDLMKYFKRLTALNVFYNQAAIIFPYVISAPRYFTTDIPLGTLTQTANAFGQVQGSLSWFVDTFTTLADWMATVNRLTGFVDAMEAARRDAERKTGFEIVPAPAPELVLEGVEVALPNGRVLLDKVDLTIARGDRVLLQGASGSGKSTLFRVLAGLWPFGRGVIRVPAEARVLFLPQKPYLPIGSLAAVLAYPDNPDRHEPLAIGEALTAVGLGYLADRLDEVGNWSLMLSPGEQQRLAFARALLNRPDWLFVDEATSAIEETGEAQLYGLLRERLPETTLVSIAHKSSTVRFHDRRLLIDPTTRTLAAKPVAAE
jgi:putative ATP-binding cassette transporter